MTRAHFVPIQQGATKAVSKWRSTEIVIESAARELKWIQRHRLCTVVNLFSVAPIKRDVTGYVV